MDVYEKLATSKLDDDVNISVVLGEAPTKLRDSLLVNCQQFESNHNKFRAIIQAYLNSNKSWTANDFRNDTKESDPMEVDNIKAAAKAKARAEAKATADDSGTGKGKSKGYVCGMKAHFARDCWSRANQDRTVNEVDGAKAEPNTAKEFVFTIENVVKDVSLSRSGCEVNEDGLYVWCVTCPELNSVFRCSE